MHFDNDPGCGMALHWVKHHLPIVQAGGTFNAYGKEGPPKLARYARGDIEALLALLRFFRCWGYISDTTTVLQTTHPCFSNCRRCSNNSIPPLLLVLKPCSRLGVYQKLRLIGPTVHGGAGFSLCGTGSLCASTHFRRYMEAFSTSHRRARQSKS